MATGQHRQPLAFRPRDHNERAFQIDFLKSLIAFLGKADDAIASILEGFQRAIEIDNPRHRQMFQGTGGHFGDGSRKPCAAALRQHHSVGSQGFSGTNDRTEIVGIGEAIKGQQQRRFIELAAAIDQIRKIQRVCCSGLQSDALVDGTTGHLSQTSPGDFLHKNSGGLGIPEKLHEFGSTAHLAGAPDAMDRTTGLQCRLGGVPAPKQIISHRISPVGSCFSAGLAINLTVPALATAGTDAAILAITEAPSSWTTVSKTPVIRAMPLEALIAITAISLAAVFKSPCTETPIIRATIFKTAVFKTTVTLAAILCTA